MNSNWVQNNMFWTRLEFKNISFELELSSINWLGFWTQFEVKTYVFELTVSSKISFLNSIRVQNLFFELKSSSKLICLNSIRVSKLCFELDLIFPRPQNKRAKKNESNYKISDLFFSIIWICGVGPWIDKNTKKIR